MAKKTNLIFERSYTMPSRGFFVSSAPFFDGSSFVRDWEDFGPKNLPEYFNKGYEIFEQRLGKFKGLQRSMTAEEEQELTFMLEALIHAKNARYE